MQLGGPVWHVSVASPGIPIKGVLEAECERQLAGVGDAALGEWREWSGRVFHLRRRLNAREQREVGPVVDVRGTAEARRRAERLGPLLRRVPAEVLAGELGPWLSGGGRDRR
jgi:hypothetical protein